MNDKRFVLIIVATVVFLALSLTALIRILPEERYMDNEYPSWQQQKDYSNRDGDTQEVLLLGDSRMKDDIFATELGEHAYNLALGGGTPLEMYYTLERYLQHHPQPKAVIVAFGPTHYTEMGSYEGRNLYFRYLDEENMDSANEIIFKLDGKDYRSVSKGYQHKLPTIYLKPVLKCLFYPRNAENAELYSYAEREKGRRYISVNKSVKEVFPQESRQSHFVPLNSLSFYLEELIKLCKDNNIPIYVEQLPMGNPGYQKLLDSGYMDEYKMFMNGIRDKFGIYVNDEIPLYEAWLFQDDSHLNFEGAKKLTAEWRGKYADILK